MFKTDPKVEAACDLVAETFYGRRGAWLYQAFRAVNTELFCNELPYPLIILTLTAHGRCLGWSRSQEERPPQIAIHPSVFGGTERLNPWNLPAAWLGDRFALDTVIHECMHVSVNYRLGGSTGPTSHNCEEWVGETNRLIPLLGFTNAEAGMSKTRRVPLQGERTTRGKHKTKVERYTQGNLPFECVSMFPQALRMYQNTADSYYPRGDFPVEIV